jgi:hypothetical protein
MPPLQALVALHGLWVLAFAGLVIWMVRKWPAQRLTVLGLTLFFAGLIALACFIGHDLLKWWPTETPSHRKYFIQRALFAVGTTPDIPLIQTTLAGIALWLAGRRRRRQVQNHATISQEPSKVPEGEERLAG